MLCIGVKLSGAIVKWPASMYCENSVDFKQAFCYFQTTCLLFDRQNFSDSLQELISVVQRGQIGKQGLYPYEFSPTNEV